MRSTTLARAALACAACAALAAMSAPADAHHGSATSRVAVTPTLSAAGTPDERAAFRLRLAYDVAHFDRTLRDSARYDKADLGAVTVHTLSVDPEVSWERGTSLALHVPVGVAAVRADASSTRREPGVGDLVLWLGQRVPLSGRGPVTLTLRAGLSAPTGQYVRDAHLTITDVAPGTDGALTVASFNTQASLGAGAWSAVSAGTVRVDVSERATLHGTLNATVPLNRTPDRILWGVDVGARLGADVDVSRRVALSAALDLAHHGRDDVPGEDDETGEIGFARTGGRDTLGAALGVAVEASETTRCSVEARVPLWHHVGGVQLVAGPGGALSCAFSWGLGDAK